MPWCGWKAIIGVLRRKPRTAAALATFLAVSTVWAQRPVAVTISVEDKSGAVIVGASVQEAGGQLLGRTDPNGQVTIRCRIPCRLRIEAKGFAGKFVEVSANTTVQLDPASTNQQVTVTAYRAPLGALESPATTRLLSEFALSTTGTPTMDGQMRQLPGVELFRRSSSLVANPTSQGISLRGLGSTSASRTLLTEDDVPLNDAVGGWIHWEELPELAIKRIEVVRGGASDLYGSSAIGGVVSVVPLRPTSTLGEVRSSYGGLGTYDTSALVETTMKDWGVLASGGAIGTDGFIQEAPYQRGPVDTVSNMHGQNGMFDAERNRSPLRLFVRGSGFNEARANGTPFQQNGTRLWRYATGADWQGARSASATLRLYGSTEHYRQTFSSISNAPTSANPTCTFRCGETPTRFTLVPDNELGAAAHWNQPIGAELLVIAGADVHDVRVLGSRADLWRNRGAYQSTRSSARLGSIRRSNVDAPRMDTDSIGAHGLVPEFRCAPGGMERIDVGACSKATALARREHLRSTNGCFAQTGRSLGAVGVGVSRISRSNSERALSLDAGGQQAHAT